MLRLMEKQSDTIVVRMLRGSSHDDKNGSVPIRALNKMYTLDPKDQSFGLRDP